MISFRHHVVSLVAVFLALAVGIVLGGGPLSDLGRDDRPAAAATADKPAADPGAGYGDRFANAAAPRLYADRLSGHPVALVVMPGAARDTVAGLTAQVAAAGGTVTGVYTARAGLTDAGQKALVDTLGSQLATQMPTAAEAATSTYVRMGELIGSAVSSGPLGASDVAAVRESLSGAELVDAPKGAPGAQLALMVLGDSADPAIVTGLATGLAAKTSGLVVAGDAASAAAGGNLAAVRADQDAAKVATVDGADTALGRVTATLALIRSLTTPGGSFGASGSDGAVPLQ